MRNGVGNGNIIYVILKNYKICVTKNICKVHIGKGG